MKHNTGVSNLEITNANIRAFSATAKKYGIDFALKKRQHAAAPVPGILQGRDADVMTAALRSFPQSSSPRRKSPPSENSYPA